MGIAQQALQIRGARGRYTEPFDKPRLLRDWSWVVAKVRFSQRAVIELSNLDGNDGFVINGIRGDNSGGSVSDAGDFNGDGVDDLIIGAFGADPNDDLFSTG